MMTANFEFDANLLGLSTSAVAIHYKGIYGDNPAPFSCKALSEFLGRTSSTVSTYAGKAGLLFTREGSAEPTPKTQATNKPSQAKPNNNDMLLFIDSCVALQELNYTNVPATPIFPGNMDSGNDYSLGADWKVFLQTCLDSAPLNKVFVTVFRNVPNSALVKVGLESPDMRESRIASESLEQDKITQAINMLRDKGWKIIPAESCQDFASFEATRDYRTAEQQTMACQSLRDSLAHNYAVQARLARILKIRQAREKLEFAATQSHVVSTVQASVELDALAKQQELEKELELAKQQAINAQQAQLDMAGQLALLMKKMAELEAQSKPQGKPQGKVKGNGQSATT